MQTIVVCVGSSCYVRGSEKMAETFERLIRERGLSGRVELTGTVFAWNSARWGFRCALATRCSAVSKR